MVRVGSVQQTVIFTYLQRLVEVIVQAGLLVKNGALSVHLDDKARLIGGRLHSICIIEREVVPWAVVPLVSLLYLPATAP